MPGPGQQVPSSKNAQQRGNKIKNKRKDGSGGPGQGGAWTTNSSQLAITGGKKHGSGEYSPDNNHNSSHSTAVTAGSDANGNIGGTF